MFTLSQSLQPLMETRITQGKELIMGPLELTVTFRPTAFSSVLFKIFGIFIFRYYNLAKFETSNCSGQRNLSAILKVLFKHGRSSCTRRLVARGTRGGACWAWHRHRHASYPAWYGSSEGSSLSRPMHHTCNKGEPFIIL